MKKCVASRRADTMNEWKVSCSEECLESHVRQLNASRGDVEELGDLLEHMIGNWETFVFSDTYCLVALNRSTLSLAANHS